MANIITNGLTQLEVDMLTGNGSKQKRRDGHGLFVQVSPDGRKNWVYEFTMAGRTRQMGLGSARVVKLNQARMLASNARMAVAEGRDPIAERDAAKDKFAATVMTFEAFAKAWLAAQSFAHKASQQKAERNVRVANEAFGRKPVAEVNQQDVIAMATPFMTPDPKTGALRLEAGKDLISNVARILTSAQTEGHRTEGGYPWKSGLEGSLKFTKLNKKEKAAREADSRAEKFLKWTDLPKFFATLQADDSGEARALELSILTAARPEDIVGNNGGKSALVWSEIDLDARIWTLPAARAKTAKDHRVPLSDAAVECLARLKRVPGDDRVFHGQARDGGLSANALLNKTEQVMRRAGLNYEATARNFRKTFRTWGQENAVEEHGIIEMCMAHAVTNIASQKTYTKGEAIARRTKVMEAYGRYATGGQPVADVIDLASRRA